MKTKTSTLILIMLFSYAIANAAYTSPGWSYGYELGVARGDNAGSAENFAPKVGGHIQLDIFRFLAVRMGLGYTRLHASKTYSTDTIMADYRVMVEPFRNYKYSPYIYVGTGGSKELSDFDEDIIPLFPIGVGVKTMLKKGMALEISTGYHLANSDKLDGRMRLDDDTNRFTDRKQDGFFSLNVGFSFSDSGPARVKAVPVSTYIPPTPAPVVVAKPVPASAPVIPTVQTLDTRKMDTDNDGLSDYDEINIYKSDPNKADSDGDGLSDYDEVMKYKTNPLRMDTDADGLSDYDEVMKYKTNPLRMDTDADGLSDYDEVMKYKTDPLKIDTDGDGLSDYDEVMKHKSDPLKADTDGGSVNDGIEVSENKNPLDPKDDVLDLREGVKFSLEGILFETAKATIVPASTPVLEQAYKALAANPDVNVMIIGHTDSVGSASSNQTLSFNRAEAVKNWLVTKGIAAKRMKTLGKGEDEPRATNDTAEGRTLNRRIEFEVVQ